MKDGFILYHSQMSALIEVLTNEQIGELIRLILSYRNGEEVVPPSDLRVAWVLIKNQLDIDEGKYKETCEKRRDAVNKRWSSIHEDTKAYNRIQENTKHTDKDKDKEKDKDIIEKSKPKKNAGAFIKPSLDEIKAYCLERRNNVNAEQFFAFYESNGWKVGKNSMKSWKAAIVTWESRTGSTNNVNDLRDAY